MMRKFGIIAALAAEVEDLLKNQAFGWQETQENLFYSKNFDIYLVISGVGKANAVYALARIIGKAEDFLVVGTSGGLSDEEVGSLYLSTEFVEHDMDATGLGFAMGVTPFSSIGDVVVSTCSEILEKQIKKSCVDLEIELNYGRTISGDQFLNDPEITKQKRELFGAQLVDMESAAMAKICKLNNKNIIALRYVSDNANHDSNTDWNENVKRSSGLANKIVEKIVKGEGE
jgi:adenosylhomocysteine nucleosidase